STHTTSSPFYTLSLHDALPICHVCYRPTLAGFHSRLFLLNFTPVNPASTQLNPQRQSGHGSIPCLSQRRKVFETWTREVESRPGDRKHTSELQSRFDLVCRLLL